MEEREETGKIIIITSLSSRTLGSLNALCQDVLHTGLSSTGREEAVAETQKHSERGNAFVSKEQTVVTLSAFNSHGKVKVSRESREK